MEAGGKVLPYFKVSCISIPYISNTSKAKSGEFLRPIKVKMKIRTEKFHGPPPISGEDLVCIQWRREIDMFCEAPPRSHL